MLAPRVRPRSLVGLGTTPERQPISSLDLPAGIRPRLAGQTSGEGIGQIKHQGIIHERERLERRGRDRRAGARSSMDRGSRTRRATGCGRREPRRGKASAGRGPGFPGSTAVYSTAGVPGALTISRSRKLGPPSWGSRMPETASIASRTISASSRVGALRQSKRSPASRSSALRVKPRRLAIGGRRDDQPVHRLDAPAVRDHLGGEPVEQLGVRGSPAIEPEIAGRLDQSRSEMCLPEPVDHDPREQRISRAGDPRRQPLAPPGLRCVGGQAEIGPRAHDRRDPASRHDVAGLVGISADCTRIAPASRGDTA